MGLSKSRGNMYPWVTHTHSHLGGECPHGCKYCYVQATQKRFGGTRYTGPVRLIEKELRVKYGFGDEAPKTIFIEHCNDLFAREIPPEFVSKILAHCCAYPDNTYVFQTKNPIGFLRYLELMPPKIILGTTIESNNYHIEMGHAPLPRNRYLAMKDVRQVATELGLTPKYFVTIEPVLAFDPVILAQWIFDLAPDFLNLGADSKGQGLIEPSIEDIDYLVRLLADAGIELREKHNLSRLRRKGKI